MREKMILDGVWDFFMVRGSETGVSPEVFGSIFGSRLF